MRHQVKGKRLGRAQDHRVNMMRNLVTSLVLYEKVRTTPAKAKVAAQMAEKLISRAGRRERRLALGQLSRVLFDRGAVRKVMDVLLKRYQKKQSGFTRIRRLAKTRVGDGAAQVSLELT